MRIQFQSLSNNDRREYQQMMAWSWTKHVSKRSSAGRATAMWIEWIEMLIDSFLRTTDLLAPPTTKGDSTQQHFVSFLETGRNEENDCRVPPEYQWSIQTRSFISGVLLRSLQSALRSWVQSVVRAVRRHRLDNSHYPRLALCPAISNRRSTNTNSQGRG